MTETAVYAGGADPTTVIAVAAGAAVLFPTIEAVWRRLRNSAESSPPTDVPQEDVRSIFDELEASWDSASTKALDDALGDLADELDPEVAEAKLDAAVKQWCIDRSEGAGNPPSQAQMLKVLRSVVQNAREASYRELFADHYRRLENSVDPSARPRVDNVYIRLRPEIREGAVAGPDDLSSDQAAEQILAHEYLDFRDKTSGDVEVALRQSGNLVILGEPGSGKSTLLRYLAASCAESESTNALLPVFLRLRDYSDGQEMRIPQSAVTFAERDLQSLKMHEDFFDKALSDGRCVVFLDALDEVPVEQRRGVINRVEQLTRSYPGSRFVVTSRIAGYDGAPLDRQIFPRYVAEPMDDAGVEAFIDWRFGVSSERARNLRGVLEANPNIKALVSNQLLMTILNLVHQNADAGLPLNRAKFYERAVEILVEDRDDEGKRIEPDEERQTIHGRLLTETALFLHNENREIIDREELAELGAERLLRYQGKADAPTEEDEARAYEEAESFIERAERRTGLLVEQDPGSGVFRFVHTTFREYLTAADMYRRRRGYLRHREECWEEIKVHLTDPRWREIILLLLGLLRQQYCTYLTEKILAAGNGSQSDRFGLSPYLQLAAGALANQAAMSPGLQFEIIVRLKNLAKSSEGRTVKDAMLSSWTINTFNDDDFKDNDALDALIAIKHMPEQVFLALVDILTFPTTDDNQRTCAAAALKRSGDKGIAKLTAIASDPAGESSARLCAAHAFAYSSESSDRETGIRLLTGIANDSVADTGKRLHAAWSLASLGEKEAARTVLVAIAKDQRMDISTRGRAGYLLERLGLGATETAIATQIAIANDRNVDASERLEAARALERLGEKDLAIDTLVAVVTDPASIASTREVATALLGKDGIAPLTAVATDSLANSGQRMLAAVVLVRLGERETAIKSLVDITTDGTIGHGDRVLAVEMLERLGERETAIRSLVNIIIDGTIDLRDRVFASEVLGLCGQHGIFALTTIATHSDVSTSSRLMAAIALGRLGETSKAIPTLTAIATNQVVDYRARMDAALELGALGEMDRAETVLQTIADDLLLPDDIRRDARQAMRKLNAE